MTINSVSSTSMSATSSIGQGISPASSSKQAMFDELFKKLKEEASKTPEERAKDGVLEKHGMSEDDYRQLPKDQKDAIGLEIQQAVSRVAEQRRAGLKAGDRAG